MKGRVFLLSACLLLLSAIAFAQTETGQISGVVTDPSGATVPKATVTVRSLDRQFTRTATSGPNGVYIVPSLSPGRYEVRVEAANFAPWTRQVQVSVGSRNTVDVALAVTGGATTVEVVAQASGVEVDTTSQQISQVVTGTQVTQLPTLTRDPYDLVQIAGNVNQDPSVVAGTTRGTGFNINGQRSASTNILLDGGENRDEFTAEVGTSVPLDSVQEFRVISGNFTAEYGRASGGIVNVATRSGSNSFHGSLYEFNRISTLAANSYQNNATGLEKDRFTRNQFGYSIGGPVLRDRLFFFSSTEWIRVRSRLNNQASVLTPEFIALTNPAAQSYFNGLGQLRPDVTTLGTITLGDLVAANAVPAGTLATVPGVTAATPIFRFVNFPTAADAGGGSPQNTYFTVHRIDLNITDKTTLYGRYALDSEDYFPGTNSASPYAGFETGQTVFNQNLLLNLNHVFTPSLVSQTKVAYNRMNNFQPLGPAGDVPGLFMQPNTPFTLPSSTTGASLAGAGQPVLFPGYLPLFPGFAIPFGGPQNLYQFYEDFSWTRGSHQFRFGGQYVHTRDNRTFGAFQTATMTLASTGQLAEALQNLAAGQLFQFQGAVNPQGAVPCVRDAATGELIQTPQCTVNLPVGAPRFSRNNRFNDFAVYIQDTWRVLPRFTLNLGVRWEYFGPQHNVDPSLDANFYPGQGDNLFERIANGQVLRAPDSPIGALWRQDWNNVAPRVGFAWDILGNGSTSLRGGYGMAYERNFGNVTFNVIQNPPNYAVIALTSGADVPAGSLPITTSNAGPLSGTTPPSVPLPPTSLRAVDPEIDTAYAHMWSLALERQLVQNTVVALEYSGSRGIHQYAISNFNPVGGGTLYLGNPITSARINPQFTGINFRSSNGDSYYHGLNVRFQSNNFGTSGLTLSANYTWSHAIDNLSTTFSETNNAFNLGFLDPFNPGLDRGNADFDVRHRVVASAVWEVPWLRNDRSVAGHILGGWSVAPIFTANTGSPFSVYDCTFGFNACARYTPATTAGLRLEGSDDPPAAGANNFNYLVLPPAATQPNPVLDPTGAGFGLSDLPPYPANMTRRNAFRGPGHWNLDFGVYKNFAITERVGLQFRGELFNLFNHANMFVIGTSADVATSSIAAGEPGCPAGGGACPVVQSRRGGLGLNPTSDTRERRNVQLGVKLTF